MNDQRVRELLSVYRDGLLQDTLPFWIEHGVDHEHGGFITSLNRNGSIVDTDKTVWQQGRFTWLLAELYNAGFAKNESQAATWLDLARHGAKFLEQRCFDPNDGRMWFHLTREGQPIRKRRYAFSESFAAIAFGELALATGEQHYADLAQKTFRQFIDHHLNPVDTPPKFTGTRPTRGLGFPMISIVTAQELRQSINLPDANERIDEAIDTIKRFHLKPDIQCVMETVGNNGELIDHFDGRTLNPGHAIEGAWFIMQEGKLRDDETLVRTGLDMLDWMWHRGWDQEHGGMLYFVDVNDLPVQEYWHDMKFWWPQNETIIATLLAYQLTGDEKYSRWHQQVHDWAYAHFADEEHGEWFGYLHRDGTVSTQLKGNHWKGPFHLPRMQLVCSQLLEQNSGHC